MSAAAEKGLRVIGAMTSMPIGGNGPAMTRDAVIAWAAKASAGASIVYALGHLPAWAKGPKAMRDMAERGLVDLHCERTKTPKHYVAVRTSKAWPVGGLAAPRIMRVPPERGPDMARLMELLTEDAADKRPCRSNAELAMLCDLPDRNRAKYLLGQLVREGAIRVDPVAAAPGRIVTIVATGAATGVSDDAPHGLAGRRA